MKRFGDSVHMVENEILIYQTEDGQTKIDVKFQDETVWLTQAQLCELYQTSKSNISEHIKHIFEEGELEEAAVVRKFRTTAADGKNYNTIHYNLDMIISLGYRVKSKIATNFRRWATERLKEYMIKGFTMDDERLKNLGGGNYWKELLDRIRDIRSSEKVMYRQVLDLYATSVDYDPNLFISVHSNAVGNGVNESVDYPVAYVLLNGSSTDIGLKLAKVVESVMGTAQNGRTATRRGTNGEYYGVLRGANAVGTPGIIMEHSLGTQSRLKWKLNCSLSSRQLKNIKFFSCR